MRCPSCTREIRDDLKFCPHCGFRIVVKEEKPAEANRPASKKPAMPIQSRDTIMRKWKIFGAIIFCTFGAYFFMLGYNAYSVQRNFKACQLARRTGEYQKGVDICEAVLKKDSRMTEAWIELAKNYYALDQNEKAFEIVSKALKWSTDPELYSMKGDLLFQKGLNEDALEAMEQAVSLNPDDITANKILGYLYQHGGNYDQAIKYFSHALEQNPPRYEIIEINEQLGDIYSERKEYDKAVDAYLAVRDKDMNLLLVCIKLSEAYLDNNNLDEAMKEIDRCVQIDPEDEYVGEIKNKVIYRVKHLQRVKYVALRKELDDIFIMLYTALQSYISRVNNDPEAYISQDNIELDDMIRDTNGLLESYRSLTSPEDLALAHSNITTAVSIMKDTMEYLQKYLENGEMQRMKTLAEYLHSLELQKDKIEKMWEREFEELDIGELLEEARKQKEEKEKAAKESGPEPEPEPEKTESQE